MSPNIAAKAAAGIVALVYLAVFISDGLPIRDAFGPFGAAVSAVTLLWFAFDRWLWRVPVVRHQVAHRPFLDGTWLGTLSPKSTNPESGEPWPGSNEVYLVISQTYSTVHVRLHTQNGSSETVTTKLERTTDGAYELYSVYRFEPQLGGRDGNQMHYGTLRLRTADGPTPRLVGEYWTDRETIGVLELTQRSRRRARDYGDAKTLF